LIEKVSDPFGGLNPHDSCLCHGNLSKRRKANAKAAGHNARPLCIVSTCEAVLWTRSNLVGLWDRCDKNILLKWSR
jgi:hypothetical protein